MGNKFHRKEGIGGQRGEEGQEREEAPEERAFATTCMLMSLIMVPFGCLFIASAIPTAVRRFRFATEPYEKLYWGLTAAGHLLITYGAAVLILLLIDGARGEQWNIVQTWPLLSRGLYGFDNRLILLLLDLLAVFACGLGLLCVSRIYGYTDEDNAWWASDWLIQRQRLHNKGFKSGQVPIRSGTSVTRQRRENT
ncbi:hypothetical protein [Noviherbaspirillum sp.]|uniref:hypothetical protein n=1 Tax=Noviherbaspirillum sp. TaxID=1926288 RepID=UPI002FE122A3